MARGQDLLFAHHGGSNEDNATKNLTWLLNTLPQEITVEILRPIAEAFSQEALLNEIDPDEDIDVVAQEKAKITASRTGQKVLLGLAQSGHSYENTDVVNFSPESDDISSESVPDLVIQLGDKLVIAIEAKDGGFSNSQLQNHARWISAESFETITWRDLADQFNTLQQERPESDRMPEGINATPLPSDAITLLLSQYESIIRDQLTSRSRILASSDYTKGSNFVKARKKVDDSPGKLTGHVAVDSNESLPVPIAINFRASGENTDGQRLWFTRGEWVNLLKSIDEPKYHRGLARGDISDIVVDYESKDCSNMTVAYISDSDGNEKEIYYGVGRNGGNDALLRLQRSTENGGPLTVPPMFSPDEFAGLFADSDRMHQLFTDPNTVFDELKSELYHT